MVHDNRAEFTRIAEKIKDFVIIFSNFQPGQNVPVSVEDRLKRISVYVSYNVYSCAIFKWTNFSELNAFKALVENKLNDGIIKRTILSVEDSQVIVELFKKIEDILQRNQVCHSLHMYGQASLMPAD